MLTSPRRHASRRSVAATHRGFTLLEVILVLVILVALASLAVGFLGGTQDRANVNTAKTQVGLFASNIERYKIELGQYPGSLNDLVERPSNLKNPQQWSRFLDKPTIPLDPWGNAYEYAQPGKRMSDSFDVWSAGPDKVSGTDDDIGNWD